MNKISKQNENIEAFEEQDNQLFEVTVQKQDKRVIGYLPALFTTASLPFRNVNKPTFVRKASNGITLTLTALENVPFGRYGRLLLSVLTTHAVISKEKGEPVLIEYASLADLLKEMQLPKQRGSDVREQLECFTGAAFSFSQKIKENKNAYLFKEVYEDGNYPKGDVEVTTKTTGTIRFTEAVQYKEIDDGSNDNKIGAFKILLPAEFTAFCQSHAVPIDYTVYKEISSASGKDIYAWLVYRNNGMDPSSPVFIPRKRLVEQFMPVDEKNENFSKQESVHYSRILEEIKKIKEKYYPEVKYSIDSQGGGIMLYKSPTPVIKDDPRYALITTDL